jgi:hypothetical protein
MMIQRFLIVALLLLHAGSASARTGATGCWLERVVGSGDVIFVTFDAGFDLLYEVSDSTPSPGLREKPTQKRKARQAVPKAKPLEIRANQALRIIATRPRAATCELETIFGETFTGVSIGVTFESNGGGVPVFMGSVRRVEQPGEQGK